MNRSYLITGLFVIGLYAFSGVRLAQASCEPSRVDTYWQKHTAAKKRLMRIWVENRSSHDYADALFDIAKYEIFLTRNCVRYGHEAFISRLGGDVKSEYDYPVFAYRVFQSEFNRLMGYEITPAELFRGRSFEIYQK